MNEGFFIYLESSHLGMPRFCLALAAGGVFSCGACQVNRYFCSTSSIPYLSLKNQGTKGWASLKPGHDFRAGHNAH